MSAATDAWETKMLQAVFPNGKAYVSLHAADPGETGTASPEISGGAYARQEVTMTINGSTATNSAAVEFTSMPAVTVGGVGFWDAPTGGMMMVHLALAQTKTVTGGDSLKFAAGNLAISAD